MYRDQALGDANQRKELVQQTLGEQLLGIVGGMMSN